MSALAAAGGPLRPFGPAASPFAALVRSVLGQQVSVRAADAIAARLVAASDYAPARLAALSGDELRALGLSWAKVRTVHALAAAALNGQIDFDRLSELDDEAVIAALLPLPGIGRWTAEMFLMFALGRPDVFSFGDLVLRQRLEQHYPGQDHRALVAGWAPHRTTAARLLWGHFAPLPEAESAGL